MATLMGLGLRVPDFAPFDLAASRKESMANQTALIALEELKRQQQTEALVRQKIQQDPGLLLNPGGSTLASPALTMPPGGPQALQRGAGVSPQGGGPIPPEMAQQLMPTVTPPGGMPGGPPQSTLAGLAPQPRQNPIEALIRENPEMGLKIMQMQQAQQDQQLKRQGQHLEWGLKSIEAVAQISQGVTDQDSLDQAREYMQQIAPQAAARLPQVYTKAGMEAFQAQALSVKERQANQLEQLKIQTLLRGQDVDMLKLQQQGGKLNYQTDAQGNIVAVPEYAGGTAGVQSRPVLGPDGQPIKSLEGQKLTTDQSNRVRTQEGELRTHVDKLLTDYYIVRDSMGRIEASGADPSAAGDLALITAFMKMLDPSTGVRDVEFKNAATAGGLLEQVKARVGYVQSGERLSDDMRKDLLERSRRLYAQYERDYGQVKQQYRDLTTRLGGNPANVVLETGSTAAQPPSGGATVLSEADIAATMKGSGKSREEVIAAAKAKHYTVR
jgi:hypothetical protein